MKKYAHSRIIAFLSILAVCCITLAVWSWLRPIKAEFKRYSLLLIVPVTMVLLLYIVPRFYKKSAEILYLMHGAWRFTRLTPGSKLSVGMAVVLAALWISSELWWCEVRWHLSPQNSICAYSSMGVLGLGISFNPGLFLPTATGFEFGRIDSTRFARPRPIGLDSFSSRRLGSYTGIRFPQAMPLAALLVLPTICVYRGYGRWRDPGEHFCAKCDYDLTGNVSGVCPECGTAIEPAPKDGIA